MNDSTEGFLLTIAGAAIGLIRVLEEKGELLPQDVRRLYDHAGLWLSELDPGLMSPAAREFAVRLLEDMAQKLPSLQRYGSDGPPSATD